MSQRLARAGFDVDFREALVREDSLATLLGRDTYELKTEHKGLETGNHYVELEQIDSRDGLDFVPSGLAVTTAGWWVIELPYKPTSRYLLLRPDDMGRLKNRALADGRRAYGGDFHNTRGALVPFRWMVP